MNRRIRLGTAVLLTLLAITNAYADKEVFGWNQTAHTNTTYINDPYWLSLEYYSPVWFDIVDQGDTLFDLHSSFSPAAMKAFADVADTAHPGTKVVPCVQYFTILQPPDSSWIDSLLIRPEQRTRIIGQIKSVVDTLHFDGINIDFEYPGLGFFQDTLFVRPDSLFSVFMAELADSVAGHVSCAVAPVMRSTYSNRFEYGVLPDGSHGNLVLQMVYDLYGSWSSQTGPTAPLWWWKENADTTKARYLASLSRFALAGPTYGLDFNVTGGGDASRRPRAGTNGASKPYFSRLSSVIAVSQADHDNNADNFPIQWSFGSVSNGVPSSYGRDSTAYIPYTEGGTDKQLWYTGVETYVPFLRKLNGTGIEHTGVWCATTNSDSLIWQVFNRWKNGSSMIDTAKIDTTWKKWADNDMIATDNGVVDHPWTEAPDTLYLEQHVLAPDTTRVDARESVISDLRWDSIRFRYKLHKACNLRLMIFRDADTLWSLGSEVYDYWKIGAGDDTVCVFRSNLDDTTGVSKFDEGRWGQDWSWIAENFGYKLKPGALHGDTARVINEVVWNGEIDTAYVLPGPFPDDPGTAYPRYGADCDSNFIADEGVYLVRLETDDFAEPGFAPDDTLKLQKTKAIVVDRFAPRLKKLELWNIWPGESEPETTVVRKAEWKRHPFIPGRDSLFVTEQKPASLDTLELHLEFSERLCRTDSLKIEYKLLREEEPEVKFEFNVTKWDTVVYPDDKVVARSSIVWTDALRSHYAGKYQIRVRAYDTALNQLDADPTFWAERTESGIWVKYQKETGDTTQTQEGGWDGVHWFLESSWRDVLAHCDVSKSVIGVTNGWTPVANHVVDSLFALMEIAHEDSGRKDIWRAGVFRYYGFTDENDGRVELMAALTPDVATARNGLIGLWQGSVGWGCSIQGATLDSASSYFLDPGNHSIQRYLVIPTDGEINRGEPIADQEEIWARVATDSSLGGATTIYAVMPIERANMSDAMCAAVVNSGGSYLAAPESEIFMGGPVSRLIYEDIKHKARLHMAHVESTGTRTTHWIHIDHLVGRMFLVGAWALRGLNLALGEEFCGGGPSAAGEECGDCTEEEIEISQDPRPVRHETRAMASRTSMSYERARSGEKEKSIPKARTTRKDESRKREEIRKPPDQRTSMTLYDANGLEVSPTGTIGSDIVYWNINPTVADTGMWRVEVSNATRPYELKVGAEGGVWIELAGERLLGESEATDILIRIRGEYEVSNPSWELVDQGGQAVGSLTLYDDGSHGDGPAGDGTYGGSYAGMAEDGMYRVRMNGTVAGARIERVTREGIWVVAEPEFEFVTPSAGVDTATGGYSITWTDSSEFAARIALYYDTDDSGADGTLLVEGLLEDDEDDLYMWNTWEADEGEYWIYAEVTEGVNPAKIVYSIGSVLIQQGLQEGWPVSLGGQIEKNVCLSDLDDNGTKEMIVGATDSLLYLFNHDGTDYSVNWPFYCHGKVTSSVAVGDVDDDGYKEIVVACADTALVWVLSADGVVESGWPQTMRMGTWSAPLLVDLVGGDGIPEIVVAGYDDSLWAWDGFATPLGGNWPVDLGHINQNSSPAGGDIDQDGENEIIVSSRYGSFGAKVRAIGNDGSIKWEYETDYPVWTSPAIADVDRDGKAEVMFTTFGFVANTSRLFVLNGEDGSEPSGWIGGKVIGMGGEASPAVGYVDGSLHIVIGDGDGEVELWDGGGTRLWQTVVSDYAVKAGPLLMDLTGDQTPEIVVGTNRRVYTLNSATGDTISAYCRGTSSDTRSVAVGDLDGDDDLELVATGFSGDIFAWDLPGEIWSDGQEWPQLQRDEAKTGEYMESASPVAPEFLEAEFVAPDSMRVIWQTVSEDIYGRDELVKKYAIYRDDEPYGVDGSTLAGEVNAPDTTFTEQSAAVGDPNQGVFYRVKAEDQYGNRSDLSDGTVGEVDFGTGGPGKRRDRQKRGKPIAR